MLKLLIGLDIWALPKMGRKGLQSIVVSIVRFAIRIVRNDTIRVFGDTNCMLYRLCSWIVFDTIRYRPESYESRFETRYGLKLVSELGRVDPPIWNSNFFFPSVFWRADSGHLIHVAYSPRLSSLLSFLVPSFVFICVWARREPQWSHGGRVVVAQLSHGGGAVVAQWWHGGVRTMF